MSEGSHEQTGAQVRANTNRFRRLSKHPQVQGQWQREKAPIRKASFHCGSRLEPVVKYVCGQKDCHYLTLFFKVSVSASYAVREDNRKIIQKRIFFIWCDAENKTKMENVVMCSPFYRHLIWCTFCAHNNSITRAPSALSLMWRLQCFHLPFLPSNGAWYKNTG